MAYQINPALWTGVFAVPVCVADEHLRLCSGLALKVLLQILRHPEQEHTAAFLADTLRQAQSDVADALNYWEEQGVLLPENGAAAAAPPAARTEEPAPPPLPATKPVVSRVGRPHFPREEAVSLIEGEPALASLADEGQSILGRAFTSADLDSLVALHSYYGLSLHFILTAMHYCASIGKRSVGYVESVCTAWLNDDVTDENIDDYVDLLQQRRTNEDVVRRIFGIGNRSLIARERAYISDWFENLKTTPELIALAYEKTIERTGKLSFAYINTILTVWSKKQITTVQQANAEALPPKQGKGQKKKADEEAMQRLVDEFMSEEITV